MNIELACTPEACVASYYGIPLFIYLIAVLIITGAIVARLTREK
jgi:hypothetical protein